MKKALWAGRALWFVLSLAGCAPAGDRPLPSADLTPPVLVAVTVEGPRTVALEFDDAPRVDRDSCAVEPALGITAVAEEGNKALLTFDRDLTVGGEYRLRMAVEDGSGNGLWLIARFYGFNPSPPRLVINEFITRGSSTHPDLVEIKVVAPGDMGGVCFYHGSPSNSSFHFVFPSFRVAAGDFILLHARPQGLPEEINETAARDASGGLDASPSAFDFWVPGGAGLSGNNGVISLYNRPYGAPLDAVLYSTRTAESDTAYRGFGSWELLEQAEEIAAAGAWQCAGERVAPEDAVNPDPSTATRSLCRSALSADTDGRTDWHVVPTRQASFGRDNSEEVYEP